MDNKNEITPESDAADTCPDPTKDDIDRRKKKKRLAIILSVIGGITVILLMLHSMGIIDVFDASIEDTAIAENYDVEQWRLSAPDWYTDIFTYERYLQKDRSISYSDDGNEYIKYSFDEYLVTRNESDGVDFMADYFYAAMCGDHEKLNSMHTEAYISASGAYEEFPMQKIYGIEIAKVREAVSEIDGNAVYVYIYEVNFRIQSNDGRFMRDRYSDSSIPLFYEIIDDGNAMKINRMVHIYDNISS